jgi:hypothetical protein
MHTPQQILQHLVRVAQQQLHRLKRLLELLQETHPPTQSQLERSGVNTHTHTLSLSLTHTQSHTHTHTHTHTYTHSHN